MSKSPDAIEIVNGRIVTVIVGALHLAYDSQSANFVNGTYVLSDITLEAMRNYNELLEKYNEQTDQVADMKDKLLTLLTQRQPQ